MDRLARSLKDSRRVMALTRRKLIDERLSARAEDADHCRFALPHRECPI